MIILASQSQIRKSLLNAAGVVFDVKSSPLNEAALHLEHQNLDSITLAQTLAVAKANALEPRHRDDLIIGVDQTLEYDGKVLHKPKNITEAKQQLLRLRGKSHMLHTAYAIFRNQHSIADHCNTSILTMRPLTDTFIDDHIAATSDTVLTTVGCYQLEGRGIQLMQEINGDYFSILGLPLLPLLQHLRDFGALPT